MRWLPVLAVIQASIGIAAVLSFNVLTRTQALIDVAAPWFERIGLNPYLAPLVASSLAAMLPTTLLLGLAFPIGLSLWAGDDPNEETSRRVGAFYSLNVFGAILGSILAGFVLLPALGTRYSLIAVSALATLSSIALALSMRKANPPMAVAIAVVAPMLFLMAARIAVDPFDVAFKRFHRRRDAALAPGRRADDGGGARAAAARRRCGSCISTAITRRTIPIGRRSSTTASARCR